MRRTLILVVIIVASITATTSRAGSGEASIECTSQSVPQLSIKGVIPHDSSELNVRVSYGKDSLELFDVLHRTLENLEQGVFIVVGHDLTIYALPSSIRIESRSAQGVNAHFNAIVERVKKPGAKSTEDALLRGVALSCKYSYFI